MRAKQAKRGSLNAHEADSGRLLVTLPISGFYWLVLGETLAFSVRAWIRASPH
jgi:hypothetical protein